MSSARTKVVLYHILRFLSENEVQGETIPKDVEEGIKGGLPTDIRFHYETKLPAHNVLGDSKSFRGIIGDKLRELRKNVSIKLPHWEEDLLTHSTGFH